MGNLDRYFEKCIKDAFKSEEREYKPERVTWFYIVVDNQILFLIDTPYAKVNRKATYRIRNNVKKNFGFDVKGNYFIDAILQPNSVCNHFKVGDRNYFLCENIDYDDMERGEVFGSGRYEKLCKAYHGVSTEEFKEKHDELHLPFDISWNDYRETYLKAYGRYPEVEIKEQSKTVK